MFEDFAFGTCIIRTPLMTELKHKIEGRACLYPEGDFYFMVKNESNYQDFSKGLNQMVCGQDEACSSSTNLSQTKHLGYKLNYQNMSVGHMITREIEPGSVFVVDGDKLRSLIVQGSDLFLNGSECETADIAIGRLFFYEHKIFYQVDKTGRSGVYFVQWANTITPSKPVPQKSKFSWNWFGTNSGIILVSGVGLFVILVVFITCYVCMKPWKKVEEPPQDLDGSDDEGVGTTLCIDGQDGQYNQAL